MNCYTHERLAAVGICSVCQKAICRACVGRDAPRLVCASCLQNRAMFGYEFRSRASIGGWPVVHVCMGVDPATMRPRVAKGVVAIGNIAVGAVAIAGVAFGLVTVGGVSVGLVLALGGLAVGLGVSFGGLAVGAVAVGGAAFGYLYAIGGLAIGPAVIDAQRCDPAARAFAERWLQFMAIVKSCR